MRRLPDRGDAAHMSNGAENVTVRIVIESLHPPSGHGSLEGQKPWTFSGWLELMEKVEEIRSHRDRRPPPRRHRCIGGTSP